MRSRAFGDSMMWGQGLRRHDCVSWLIISDLRFITRESPIAHISINIATLSGGGDRAIPCFTRSHAPGPRAASAGSPG
jgi:hypothetical protein